MNITQKDIKTLWRSPVMWLTLASMAFMSFWLLWQMVERYQLIQANLAYLPNPPNITTALWVPYVMLLAKLLMLIIAYTSSFTIAQERAHQTLWYLLINQTSHGQIIIQKYKAQWLLLLFVFLLLLLAAALLAQGGTLNGHLVLMAAVGLVIFVLWLMALGLLISACSQSSATAFLSNVVVFIVLWMLGGEGVAQEYGANWLHILSPAHHLRWFTQGVVALSSIAYFLLGAVAFLWLSAQTLKDNKVLIRKVLPVCLLWLFVVFMSARFVSNWHMKSSYDEIITPQAQSVLQQQPNLRIEVFAQPDSVAAGLVNNFLEPLKPHLKNLTIEYLDIFDNPDLVKSYGITQQGEMVVHHQDDNFQLSTLSYEAFFNGLKQLSQKSNGGDEQWLVFLDDIEGKSFSAGDLAGLSDWLDALNQANYQTVVLPYRHQLQLPDNVKLLILASPLRNWQEPDIQWLQKQINRGVSVLWLADPSTASQQPALSLLFDVMLTDAYHQGHLIIKDYNQHPINKAFDRPLDLIETMPYMTGDQALWQNQQGETLASTKEIGLSRMMVVGDSDFLSDTHLRSGGNLEMSFRMIDWLLHRDDRIDLPSIGVKGTQLHLQRNEILLFASLTLLLIPLALLGMCGYRWRKNKQ